MTERNEGSHGAVAPLAGGLMKGKRALITGVANERSLAWAIAQAFHAEGAELAFTYPGEAMERRVRPLAESLGAKAILDCDVGKDGDIDRTVADLRKIWDRVDVLVHSIGYAPREAIGGDFLDGLTRENFRIAHDISAYSFPAMAKAALNQFCRVLAVELAPLEPCRDVIRNRVNRLR